MLQLHLSGKSILTSLALLLAVLGVLALVWLLAGPGIAIGSGIVLILVVRGLFALINPATQ